MDAFKAAEIERMRLGGNKPWRDFFEGHEENKLAGVGFEDATIKERYESAVGEEWKERLTAKVEGKEYVPGAPKPVVPKQEAAKPVPRATTQIQGRASPSPSLGDSASGRSSRAKVDDKYFSKLGEANAARPADLHPSQGGKYAGFGSEMPAPTRGDGPPGLDELQRDPVAALTKGFGWFGGMVGKTARQVNEGYIAPAAQRASFHIFVFCCSATNISIDRRSRPRSSSPHHRRPTRQVRPDRRPGRKQDVQRLV